MPGEFPLSQSPLTQAMQQPQMGPADEDEQFSRGFEQLAYQSFGKTHPELLNAVVTFRVLATEVRKGSALGTFILRMGQEVLFVPCVLVDNAVKPLDMFYARSRDRFYPLTQPWLTYAMSFEVNSLGTGIKPPKDLTTDVDIRNVILPPTQGRYSYASLDDAGWEPFVAAQANEERGDDAPRVFLEVVARMPDTFKVAMARMLERRPAVMRKAAEYYGGPAILSALAPRPKAVKVADDHRLEVPQKHDVYLATAATPVQQMKSELGPGDSPNAYRSVRLHGFYMKDRRESVKNTVEAFSEGDLILERPGTVGLYRVFSAKGESILALIIPNPIKLMPHCVHTRKGGFNGDKSAIQGCLVILQDGRAGTFPDIFAEPVATPGHETILDEFERKLKDAPSNNERGLFLSFSRATVRATDVTNAQNVTSTARYTTMKPSFWDGRVMLAKDTEGDAVLQVNGSMDTVLPSSFKWLPVKAIDPSDLLTSPDMIYRAVEHGVKRVGGTEITVKKANDGYMVAGQSVRTAHEAIVKTAMVYDVSLADATDVVEAAHHGMPARAWARKKTAADDGAAKKAPPSDGGGGEDPGAEGMDPAMMAPPGPPPPSGLDLAIQEKIQLIQQQRAALDQQEQMLTEVHQRAGAIDQGGGAMAAPMGAASMAAGPPSLGGQQPMAPMPPPGGQAPMQGGQPPMQGQQPPMDPSMQGGQPGMDPSMQGGQPPMDPNMDPSMQGGQPGMDPSMQGMDPSMQQQPPMAVMPEEPNPALFDQQVNPEYLEDAMQLNSEGVFDAAAVASLAKVKNIRDLLLNYTPTLDNAIDRLGRTLLLLYVKAGEIRESVGQEDHEKLELQVRDTFQALGLALNSLNQFGERALPGSGRRA